MEMTYKHKKYIEFIFTNSITETIVFKISFPYDTKLNVSPPGIYKRYRELLAEQENVDAEMISTTHKIVLAKHHDSMVVYEWNGGISLYVPLEATDYDYSIILKQLEVLEMKFKKPAEKETPAMQKFLVQSPSYPVLLNDNKSITPSLPSVD